MEDLAGVPRHPRESDLHYRAKVVLYHELQRSSRLYIWEPCTRWEWESTPGLLPCAVGRTRLWLEGWDSVAAEATVAGSRVDLLLRRQGAPLGAIEVWAGHRADRGVEGMPILEVRASDIADPDQPPWSADQPLAPYAIWPTSGGWLCPSHVALSADPNQERLNGDKEWYARLVDWYWPSGKKYRDVLTVEGRLYRGNLTHVLLRARGRARPLFVAQALPGQHQRALGDMAWAYRRYLKRGRAQGGIADSPMKWRRAARMILSSDLVVYSEVYFPRRYVWNVRWKTWELLPECQDPGYWDSLQG